MRRHHESARPGGPSARDHGLRGGTYGPASVGHTLSKQEAFAQEHGETLTAMAKKPKKYASPKRARAAKDRATKRAIWDKYG